MIRVKKVRENAIIPERQGNIEKSSCIDLTIAKVSINGEYAEHYTVYSGNTVKRVVNLLKGDIVVLHTGLAMQLPPLTEGWLMPRSSHLRKQDLYKLIV